MTSDRIARLRQMANCVTFSEREQEDIRWVCRCLELAEQFLMDDGAAISYQSLAQYRTAALKVLRGEPLIASTAPSEPTPEAAPQPSVADEVETPKYYATSATDLTELLEALSAAADAGACLIIGTNSAAALFHAMTFGSPIAAFTDTDPNRALSNEEIRAAQARFYPTASSPVVPVGQDDARDAARPFMWVACNKKTGAPINSSATSEKDANMWPLAPDLEWVALEKMNGDQFARGVIAALGVVTSHDGAMSTMHRDIIQSVGEEAVYMAAEEEDYEWAGLDKSKKRKYLRRRAAISTAPASEPDKCAHEDTVRQGAIWTKCQQCGACWSDDDGPMIRNGQIPRPVVPASEPMTAKCETCYGHGEVDSMTHDGYESDLCPECHGTGTAPATPQAASVDTTELWELVSACNNVVLGTSDGRKEDAALIAHIDALREAARQDGFLAGGQHQHVIEQQAQAGSELAGLLYQALDDAVIGQGSYSKNYDGNKLAAAVRAALAKKSGGES